MGEILRLEGEARDLEVKINEYLSKLSNLNDKNHETKRDIFRFENANILFESLASVAYPERSSSVNELMELDQEHINILTEKRDAFPPLRKELTERTIASQTTAAQIESLSIQCAENQNAINRLTDDIMKTQNDILCHQTEISYIEDQIKQRKQEVAIMVSLRREAEGIVSDFVADLNKSDELSTETMEAQKACKSLENEISVMKAEIESIETEMRNEEAENQRAEEEEKNGLKEHDKAVDWEHEKNELREELKRLQDNLAGAKARATVLERDIVSDQVSKAQYGPLVKKWRKRETNVEINEDDTIKSLTMQLNEAKKQRDLRLQKDQDTLNDLMNRNMRLENEVNKSKSALGRIMTQFRADENLLRFEIDKLRDTAEAEEQKLLRDIQAVQCKLAQMSIKKR